jgi:hypothetical protein
MQQISTGSPLRDDLRPARSVDLGQFRLVENGQFYQPAQRWLNLSQSSIRGIAGRRMRKGVGPACATGDHYCLHQQDDDRRIRGCTERIRQYPKDAAALLQPRPGYLNRGELDRAIADNTKVIEIDSLHAAAYSNRGIAEGRDPVGVTLR